jgi:hypothetical protein
MMAYGKVELWLHHSRQSALDGGEWPASRPGPLTLWKIVLGTHWIECWVGPRDGLRTMEMTIIFSLEGIEPRSIVRCYTDCAIQPRAITIK